MLEKEGDGTYCPAAALSKATRSVSFKGREVDMIGGSREVARRANER